MKRWLVGIVGLLVCEVSAWAQMDSFPYEVWSNKEGRTLNARLLRIAEKEISLQAKKGGRRLTVRRDTLSEKSARQLLQHREAVIQELRKENFGAQVIYKAVMVGVEDRLQKVLFEKTKSFKVTDFKIETNKVEGYIVLEDVLFLKVQARPGYELFERDKALYDRPSRKDRRYDYRTNINELSRQLGREGNPLKIEFEEETTLSFGTVGITDGVIIQR